MALDRKVAFGGERAGKVAGRDADQECARGSIYTQRSRRGPHSQGSAQRLIHRCAG